MLSRCVTRRPLSATIETDLLLASSTSHADWSDLASHIRAPQVYVDCMVSKCVEVYIAARVHAEKRKVVDAALAAGGGDSSGDVVMEDGTGPEADGSDLTEEQRLGADPRLLAIVERMFARCFDDGSFRYTLGIAVEAQNVEKVEEALARAAERDSSGDGPEGVRSLLGYVFSLCQTSVPSRGFRQAVLRVLVKQHLALPQSLRDRIQVRSLASCFVLLDSFSSRCVALRCV